METQQHKILQSIYELEAEILDQGNKDKILNLRHTEEQIWNLVKRQFPEITRPQLESTLLTLWKNADILSWRNDARQLPRDAEASANIPLDWQGNQSKIGYEPMGELEFSSFHNRDIDITPKEDRYYRSRIAEVIRMLGFNRQRFGLSPSTTSYSYKLQKRLRPKREIELSDAIAELHSIAGTNDARKKAIELVLEGLKPIVHGKIARFQLDATISALTPAKKSRPIGIVAGVSSGKTIGFSLPAMILAVEKSLMKQGGLVRALFVYPRSTLVEDQYQRITEWTENINRIAGERILIGPALDAAGKLPASLGNPNMGLISALKTGFDKVKGRSELVLTTTETLRRRIQNPYAARPYIEDLEILVLDEAHLLDGLQGSHNSLMFQRIENARRLLGKTPINLRIVASATMAEPDDHISKLFNCARKDVLIVKPDPESEEIFGTFHHLLLRSGQGLSLLSAITNGASCLVHNRANGLIREYYDLNKSQNSNVFPDPGGDRLREPKDIRKTIGFVDSLSTIGSWSFTLRDNENCIADKKHMGEFDPSQRKTYPYFTWFHEPLWKLPAHLGFEELASQLRPICINCKAGIRVEADPNLLNENQDYQNAIAKIKRIRKLPFDPIDPQALGSLDKCTYFKQGMCWWFSQDDERQIDWIPKSLYGHSTQEKQFFNEDTKKYQTFGGQLRPMQITSNVGLDNDELLTDVNNLFQQPAHEVFQVRTASFARRLKGEFGGDAPRSDTPWKENFSLLLASPKIEVGVDFDNVQDGILFRAIRNVASYQQKAGRVGREGNSDSLIATFMTQSPTDFHYYRNPVKLSAPGHLDAVPLKIDNRDVIRCHLYLSCFDFVAMRGRELMIVRNARLLKETGDPEAVDFDKTVMGLADEFPTFRNDLKKHLTFLIKNYKDIDVEPAIECFHKLIQILNFPAHQLNDGHDASWTFASLMQRRKHIAVGGEIAQVVTFVTDLQAHLRECERGYIEELHKDFPISFFREVERSVIEGRIDDFENSLPDIQSTYEKLEKVIGIDNTDEDKKYFYPAQNFLSKAYQIGTKLSGFGDKRKIIFCFVTIAGEYDDLISRSTQAGTLMLDLYYLDNILTRLSYFIRSYPYVMPQNFFEHPKSDRVRVKFKDTPNRIQNEARPIALFDLLPGSWTYRYGSPLKSPSGKIECQSSQGPAQIDLNAAEAEGFRTRSLTLPIEAKKLPEDFPPHLRNAGDYIELRAPDEVELIKAFDQVNVDKSTTLVKDGDEFDTQELVDETDEQDEWTRTQTIPSTYFRSWYDVNYEESALTMLGAYTIHPTIGKMFSDISFTNEFRLTQFCYGLTRSYTTAIIPPPMFYTVSGRPICLGDQMITDGIVFELDPKIVKSTLQDSLSPESDCSGAIFRKSLVGFLARNCDASLFTARRVREILISLVVEKLETFSFNLQDFKNSVEAISESEFEARFRECELIRFEGKPEEMRAARDRLDRYWPETLLGLSNFKSQLAEFDQSFIESWGEDILVHSIALKAFQAALLCSGAGSSEMGYFYDADAKGNYKFYIFDKVEGGNGLTELIKNHFYIAEHKRTEANANQISLPTTDFVSEFLFRMGACPSHLSLTACCQSREIVDTPKLGVSVKELLTSDIEYSLETLKTNEVARWLSEQSKIQIKPDNLDELQSAIDSASILLKELIKDGILLDGTPYDDFQRALAGCIDACPECLDDQENSVFGSFLNKEHVDNRLIGKILNQVISICDNPCVEIAKSEPEITSLKMGADEGQIKPLKKDWPTATIMADVSNYLSFERMFLFDPK